MRTQTSDFHFIRRDPNRLTYLLEALCLVIVAENEIHRDEDGDGDRTGNF
jgi:hypothetical protein